MNKNGIAFILIFLLIMLCSCKSADNGRVKCSEAVDAVYDAEVAKCPGVIYSLNAIEGESGHMSRTMMSAVLGGGKELDIFKLWDDAAMFLPSGEHPFEIAIIHCKSSNDTGDTSKLLASRLDMLKNAKAEKYPEYFEDASVTVIGNYCIMIISCDSSEALKTVKGIIKKG